MFNYKDFNANNHGLQVILLRRDLELLLCSYLGFYNLLFLACLCAVGGGEKNDTKELLCM